MTDTRTDTQTEMKAGIGLPLLHLYV